MTSKDIVGIVRESLVLGDEITINEDTILGQFDISRADVLDILHKCGFPYLQYLTDGEVNDRGRDLLRLAGQDDSRFRGHLNELSRQSTIDIMKSLKIGEVALIVSYVI
ncbi:MAG: hypothetical protein WC548_04045 [Candidatus Pacearchaeota archaeon]